MNIYQDGPAKYTDHRPLNMKNNYPTKFKFKLKSDHIAFDDNGYDIFNMNGFYNAVADPVIWIGMLYLRTDRCMDV